MSRTTPLGAPGPKPLAARPLGAPQNGAATPPGTTSMTLGTLREVRNELASLGDLLERMSKEMTGLRRAVEAVAARGEHGPDAEAREAAAKAARKAAKRAKKLDASRGEREAALEARVGKLEARLADLRRQVEWSA